MEQKCSNIFTCPVEATIQLIGGKYKAVILWHLMDNTLRYNELHKRIPKATDKMLAQQLRELEKDGLINRTVYPVVPPKTEYSLTDFGKTLVPILDEMCRWGEGYLGVNEYSTPITPRFRRNHLFDPHQGNCHSAIGNQWQE